MRKNSAAKRILSKIFKKKAGAEPAPQEIPATSPAAAPKGKVKSILITQAKPENDKHPYSDLAAKYHVRVEFMPIINLEALSAKEFRKFRINPADYSSVIFTSRNAIDQFFKLLEEMRCKISEETRYYCMTETIALYLQKYIMYRKRKVFYGDGTQQSLQDEILRHRDNGKYLLPCADNHKRDLAEWLKKNKLDFTEAVIFKTVPAVLSEKDLSFDIITLFSASTVQALIQNFPNLAQKKIRIAVFGPLTLQAATDAGLRVDIKTPSPECPSMAMALDKYLAQVNK